MTANAALASIPRRLAAYAVDIAISFAAILVSQALLYPVNPVLRDGVRDNGVAVHAWVSLTVTIPIAVYMTAFWTSRSGATPGQRLTRIQVRSTSGHGVRPIAAFVRAVVLLIPFEVNHAVLFYPRPIWADTEPGFRLGLIAVYALLAIYLGVTVKTAARQGPHDIAAGTLVVNAPR